MLYPVFDDIAFEPCSKNGLRVLPSNAGVAFFEKIFPLVTVDFATFHFKMSPVTL